MADAKSKFVQLLISFTPEDYNPELGVPSRDMITSGNKPDYEYIFSTSHKTTHIRRAAEQQIYFFNLMDGFQFIECGLPDYLDKMPFYPWNSASKIFLKKIQSVIDQDKEGFSSLVSCKQTSILAFDNSRHVCNAKKPKQNSRRIVKICPAKNPRNGTKPKDCPVVFPFDDIKDYNIRDTDQMPIEWRKYMTYGPYKGKIVDYLCKKVIFEKNILLMYPKFQQLQMWRNGVFTSFSGKKMQPVTERFQNMGEFDFFAIRYMNYFICKMVEKRKGVVDSKKITKDRSLFDFSTIFDFETLVFKIHSDDTDLLLYSLYFLEFIKYKYAIHDSFLPKIIIVQPKKDGICIHVTYLYIGIKHQLEKINNREMKTTMRSFIMAVVSWGNDILPNPVSIVPDTWMKTYVLFNLFINHSFVTFAENPKKPKYEQSCVLEGKKFKLLYLLSFATKYLKEEQQDRLWDYYDPKGIDYRGLEMFITSAMNQKGVLQKNGVQSNQTIRARLIIANIMLYSIEHALEIVSGSKRKGLSQIVLPDSCFVNIWDKYQKTADPRCVRKANELGLITPYNCIYFTKYVMPSKADDDLERLIVYSDIIYDMFHFGQTAYNNHDFKETKQLELSCSSSILQDDE